MHESLSQATASYDVESVRRIEGFNTISAIQSSCLSNESQLSCQPFDYFSPANEDQRSAVLREMDRRNVTVTGSGARKGLGGGRVPNKAF